MKRVTRSLFTRPLFTLLCVIVFSCSWTNASELDPLLPTIAAPEEFNVILVDESTVEFSWKAELLDGSEVVEFLVWDRAELLVRTTENSFRLGGIDRNDRYDFSVSAVTATGEETRRSSRVYYDLAQLDATAPDGGNHYLPPLENLQAVVLDEDRLELTWDLPAAHWSWADPTDYQFRISIGGTGVAVVNDTRYVYTGLADQGLVWLEVRPYVDGELFSRQPNLLLADTSKPAGTVINGYPGFNSVFGLRTEIYSSTTAEIFWQASQFPTTSHVYINGSLVARLNEGYSYFLSELTPGESINISVGEGWPFDDPLPANFPLLHDYPLMHARIATPGNSNPNFSNPGPVTGLRADVYSSSAAEVFWDRSTAPLARYRVFLDDRFLVETNGTSWFLDELPSGTEFRVAVSAIGPSNNETEQVDAVFNTFTDTLGPDSTDNCGVTGLRAAVYSSTAAEVFWDRNTAGTRYVITLDGTEVTNTDAVSWFADSFAAGSTHRVEVNIANDACEPGETFVDFRLARSAG